MTLMLIVSLLFGHPFHEIVRSLWTHMARDDTLVIQFLKHSLRGDAFLGELGEGEHDIGWKESRGILLGLAIFHLFSTFMASVSD